MWWNEVEKFDPISTVLFLQSLSRGHKWQSHTTWWGRGANPGSCTRLPCTQSLSLKPLILDGIVRSCHLKPWGHTNSYTEGQKTWQGPRGPLQSCTRSKNTNIHLQTTTTPWAQLKNMKTNPDTLNQKLQLEENPYCSERLRAWKRNVKYFV